ncbi:MAG: bacillithiol biosynthesis cysteine-adding enzyme BshC [Thermoanaerobaculia bacterium]
MVPFERIPGIPPLFLRYVREGAGDFLPVGPSLDAVKARAGDLSKDGRDVWIGGGQQAGLFTGPLYSLAKAAAAAKTAQDVTKDGARVRGFFWVATEDHDLAEVSQVTLPGDTALETFHLEPASEKNFRPAGNLPIPAGVEDVFRALRAMPGLPSAETLETFERLWSPGRTFGQAFVDTMRRWIPEGALEWIDPLEGRWRDRKLAFFRRALESAPEIVSALDAVDSRLRAAGFSPQVARADGDFPCFLIEDGLRRKISFDGSRFGVHGSDRTFSAAELADHAQGGGHDPSPAALLRPVLQSWLMPVAAEILGPAELAYHAQSAPLFPIFGLSLPILLPRPHLLPRGARERRAQEALEISDSEIFRARDAARDGGPPAARALKDLEARIAGDLGALAPEVESVDPTLSPVLAGTVDKVSHQLARLREKLEKAAERKDEEKNRRLETIERSLAPGGAPADRVYTPLTYLLRFGEAFIPKILSAAQCRLDGAHFVDFP